MNRRLQVLLALLAGAGLVAGCASSGEPDDYDDTVADNFARACEDANSDLPDGESSETAAGFCGCVYGFFVDNVDYDFFKDLDNDLEDGVNDDRYQNREDLDGVLVTLRDGVSVDDRTTVAFGALIDGCLAGSAPEAIDTNESSDEENSDEENSDDNSTDEPASDEPASDEPASDDPASDEAGTTTTEA